MPRKTAGEIQAEAIVWAARMDRGPLSPEDASQFEAWVSEDTRNLGAIGRLRALEHSERAHALAVALNAGDFLPAPAWKPSRRAMLCSGGAIAACAIVGVRLWQNTMFATAKGETRVIALEDGSVVTLNTQSDLKVKFSEGERYVSLLQGEALFDVAKDAQRPFVVQAGDTRVRVVGTSFLVRHLGTAPTKVMVREGIVDVSKDGATTSPPVRITANTVAVARHEHPDIISRAIPEAEMISDLAWRDGRIEFQGSSLAEAANEFARYSDTMIVIDDSSLAREEIVGLFRATDPVGFAETVAVSLNAKVRITDGEVHLTR